MDYKHFGELLKKVRIENNLTLEHLSLDICSVRQLSRIEKGESDPSIYLLHNLSKKLNIDLQEYYKIYSTSQSFTSDSIKLELVELITQRNLYEVRKHIEKIEGIKEFKKGENLQYILYGKALCYAHLDKDYILSNELCNKGLKVEDSMFDISKIKDRFYSNVGLTMINLMATNFNEIKENEKSYQISHDLFLMIDNYIHNIPFPMYRSLDFLKKLYQSLSCNLSILNMDIKEFNIALEYVNKGINFSIKENYMRFLPELLAQKSRLLLKMNLKTQALENYKNCLSFYKILRSDEEIKTIEAEMREHF